MAVPARVRTLARIVFAVALFGVLVVSHLGLQARTGFANGCAGFGGVDISAAGATAAPEAGGCGAVATGEYADFLGVSNIVWGLLFYLVVVGLRFAYARSGDDRLRKASFAFVGVGALYTAYLIYLQAAVIGSWCVLCLTSAATVATLLVLHVVEHQRLQGGDAAAAPPARAAAGRPVLRPYAIMAALAVVLLGADVALTGDVADAPAAASASAEPGPATTALTSAGDDVPSASELLNPLAASENECAYDPTFPPIADLSAFLDNPSKGSGPVTVVEVFDPNCPHCKQVHEAMRPVIEANADKATFYYVPFPLKQPTVGQAIALDFAEREGKFFPLMEEMFRRQDNTWGMTEDELRESMNAAGMDGPSVVATMQEDEALQPVLARIQTDADAVVAAFEAPGGGLSVPKVAINGRTVASTNKSYSTECFNQFIAEAAGS